MDPNLSLKEQFVISLFRFRKIGTTFPAGFNSKINSLGINIVELAFMKSISENQVDSNENVCASDLRDYLFITKAAVSQMSTSLERKGYLSRTVNNHNRRKITLTLTGEGKEILDYMEDIFNSLLSDIMERLGEQDTKQFVKILNRLVDITEDLKLKNK